MMRNILRVGVLLGLFTAVNAAADVITIGAAKDNTLYQSAIGALSNGAGQHFFVGRTAQATGSIRRGLLQFDVTASVPVGAVVVSVRLALDMSKTAFATEQAIELHAALADWGESTSDAPLQEGSGTAAATGDATWIHTFHDTDFWSSSGGDFSASVSATTNVGTMGVYTWGSTAQMVADVQSWLDDPATNHGWVLTGNESTTLTAKRFDTRENPIDFNRPALTIEFALPAGACCLESRGECNDGIDAADCSALGGRFGGDGSTCATIDPPCAPPISISLELVAGGPAAEANAGPGLTAPVFLTHAGDGSGRLFVLDQVGQIRIIKNGTLSATPFLDLTSKIISINAFFDERGVLGLAFHPDYANNGRFFVRYSAPRAGDPNERCNDPGGFVVGCHEAILAEYAVSGDPDIADPNSEVILFRVDEPEFNHDSGQVMFGPDGLLYWTLGDGGGGNDDLQLNGLCDAGHCVGNNAVCGVLAQDCVDLSACVSDEGFCSTPDILCSDGSSCLASGTTPHGPIGNGQNTNTPLGSLLRIDVGAGAVLPDDFPADPDRNYAIPADNPFASGLDGIPEIYAYGFRNPYRFSFSTDALGQPIAIVADVGQSLFEEIDFVTLGHWAGGNGRLNYGWATREGFSCFDPFDANTPPSTCSTTGPLGEPLIDPEVDYPHPTPCIDDTDCVSLGSVCNSEGFCNNIAGIAVIGGFVYRGSAYPALSGKYFFGDFGQTFVVPGGRLFYMDVGSLDQAGPGLIQEVFIAPDGNPLGQALFGIGEDEDGELYVLTADSIGPNGNGFVYRVVPPEPQAGGVSPRYIEITPPPSPQPYAIAVTPDCPSGATKFLAAPFGIDNFAKLVDFPVLLTSLEWGSRVRAFGTTIVPNTAYLVQTDFGSQLSPAAPAVTSIHGDVAGLIGGAFTPPDGNFSFVIDVVAIVSSFQGLSSAPPIYQTDLAGVGGAGIDCLPDQDISIIIDAVIAIDAFQGGDGSVLNCPDPCP